MPLSIPATQAAALVTFMDAARNELAQSRAATAIAAAAEPTETRETMVRLLAELRQPPRTDGTVLLHVVDEDQFYSTARHLRGVVAWLTMLYESGQLAAGDPSCAVPIVEELLRYAHRRHLGKVAGWLAGDPLAAEPA